MLKEYKCSKCKEVKSEADIVMYIANEFENDFNLCRDCSRLEI